MYIPILLNPNQGDIIEKYCTVRREIIGVFLVLSPRKEGRKDLLEAWCLYNGWFGKKFNRWKGLKAGSKVVIHRTNLLSEYEARQTGSSAYYIVRKQ